MRDRQVEYLERNPFKVIDFYCRRPVTKAKLHWMLLWTEVYALLFTGARCAQTNFVASLAGPMEVGLLEVYGAGEQYMYVVDDVDVNDYNIDALRVLYSVERHFAGITFEEMATRGRQLQQDLGLGLDQDIDPQDVANFVIGHVSILNRLRIKATQTETKIKRKQGH